MDPGASTSIPGDVGDVGIPPRIPGIPGDGGGGGGAAVSGVRGASSPLCVGVPWDQHYIPTLLTSLGRGHEIEGRGVTYANWWPTNRRHPKRYAVQETRDAVNIIRGKTKLDSFLEGGKAGGVDGGGGGSGGERGIAGGGVVMSRSCGYYRGGPPSDPDIIIRGEGENEEDAAAAGVTMAEAEAAGRIRPCWLFARKFSPRAGVRIARFSSVVMGF